MELQLQLTIISNSYLVLLSSCINSKLLLILLTLSRLFMYICAVFHLTHSRVRVMFEVSRGEKILEAINDFSWNV